MGSTEPLTDREHPHCLQFRDFSALIQLTTCTLWIPIPVICERLHHLVIKLFAPVCNHFLKRIRVGAVSTIASGFSAELRSTAVSSNGVLYVALPYQILNVSSSG
jgi:hypothetical protein